MEASSKKMLRISDVVQLLGLTHRALRYYEQRGLILPRRGELNIRYYDAKTRDRLTVIARLRRGGLSLRDIEEVLKSKEPQVCAGAKLARHKAALEAELECVANVITQVEGLMRPSTFLDKRVGSTGAGG